MVGSIATEPSTEGPTTKPPTAGPTTKPATEVPTTEAPTAGPTTGTLAPSTTDIKELIEESASSLLVETHLKMSDLEKIIVNVNASSELGGTLSTLLSYLQNLSADLNVLVTDKRAKRNTGKLNEIFNFDQLVSS